MRPIVKICGLMRVDDVQMCVRNGVDIIGFVVDYPRPVPWNLSVGAAKKLMAAVSKPTETCIVTGGSREKILGLVTETQPDYVQLHGGETLEDTTFLVGELNKRGVRVIKTLFPDMPDLLKSAADFCAAGVWAILLDPRTPEHAANGGSADLSVFVKLRNAVNCPVILAGGLTPKNVAENIQNTNARIIDLMTGVERCPGEKDEAKVTSLFKAIQKN